MLATIIMQLTAIICQIIKMYHTKKTRYIKKRLHVITGMWLSPYSVALRNQNISITQFLLVLTARMYGALATFPYWCDAQMQKLSLTHLHLAKQNV
jgi:hypothetical protein